MALVLKGGGGSCTGLMSRGGWRECVVAVYCRYPVELRVHDLYVYVCCVDETRSSRLMAEDTSEDLSTIEGRSGFRREIILTLY